MSAIGRFTVRSLFHNKVRTAVTILGVALAAALLTAVMTSFSSLTNYLAQEEKATSGNWTAQINTGDEVLSTDQAIQTAQDAPEVKNWAVVYDAGFAQDPQDDTSGYGHDLCLRAMGGAYQETCGVAPSEGTLPTSETEIMLPWTWKNTKGYAVGDTITLLVGERQVVSVPLDPGFGDADDMDDAYGDDNPSWVVGDYLNSNTPIVDDAGAGIGEQLVNTRSVTFTITGFYDVFNSSLMTGYGVLAGVVGKSGLELHNPYAALYLSIPDVSTLVELNDVVHELYPQPDIETDYHTSLLRYEFVDTGGAVWDVFESIVILLAIIIAVACISLIYNAFAISVAERSRQFGLLASIGASKRQLRFSIWLEALIVAVIGIPLGIAIGLIGCAVTFACLGPMIERVIAGGGVSHCSFIVSIDGLFLAAVALLTLLVVLISVWIPALRASRVTAIEALRNVESVRISSRSYKMLQKTYNPTMLWKRAGIAGRIFGVGGKIGSINHKRSAAKGRAASFSLALAVVLLMTAGMVNSYFESIITTADRTNDYDIAVGYGFSGVYQDATSQQAYQKMALFSQELLTSLEGVEGATEDGWMYYTDVDLKIPSTMVAQTTVEGQTHPLGCYLDDGSYAVQGRLVYLPRNEFDAFCAQNDIDAEQVTNQDHVQGIMVKNQQVVTSTKYVMMQTIDQTGTLEAVTGALINGQEASGITLVLQNAQEGSEATQDLSEQGIYIPYRYAEDDTVENANPETDTIELLTHPIEIVALADSVVSPLTLSSPYTVVVPFEENALIPSSLATSDYVYFLAGYNAADHVSAAEEINKRAIELQKELSNKQDSLIADLSYYSIGDYKEEQEAIKSMVLVINVFCLLFTIILMLIALANVFNTITNGLILRRREFAVMKSIGLSDRQFRRMITSECIGYGVRGFIPGIILAAVICWVFLAVVTQAFDGIGYLFPWSYLGLALILVVVALVISVFFGLRKAKSGNVVEALRDSE